MSVGIHEASSQAAQAEATDDSTSTAADLAASVERPQPPAPPAPTVPLPKSKPKLAANDIIWARVKGQYATSQLEPQLATHLLCFSHWRSRSSHHGGTALGGRAESRR